MTIVKKVKLVITAHDLKYHRQKLYDETVGLVVHDLKCL